MRQLRLFHEHTESCFERSADGRPLAYTPCRADGMDRNLRNLNPNDLPIVLATYQFTGRTPGLKPVCRHLEQRG